MQLSWAFSVIPDCLLTFLKRKLSLRQAKKSPHGKKPERAPDPKCPGAVMLNHGPPNRRGLFRNRLKNSAFRDRTQFAGNKAHGVRKAADLRHALLKRELGLRNHRCRPRTLRAPASRLRQCPQNGRRPPGPCGGCELPTARPRRPKCVLVGAAGGDGSKSFASDSGPYDTGPCLESGHLKSIARAIQHVYSRSDRRRG